MNETISPELLADEQRILKEDKALYLECLNNKPLSERKTSQEIRNGLILYWNVYRHIKPIAEPRVVRRRKIK